MSTRRLLGLPQHSSPHIIRYILRGTRPSEVEWFIALTLWAYAVPTGPSPGLGGHDYGIADPQSAVTRLQILRRAATGRLVQDPHRPRDPAVYTPTRLANRLCPRVRIALALAGR